MSFKRIIPLLLVKNGRCVKGKQFKNHVDVGDPVSCARVYQAQGADELILLSIDGKPLDVHLMERISKEIFLPVAVGGGIEDTKIARELFHAGTDKIVVHSATPQEIYKMVDTWGSQSIVYHTTQIWSDIPKKIEDVGELMYTCLWKEGTRMGPAIDGIKIAKNKFSGPIIASGGIGTLEDVKQVIEITDAVAIGTLFHFTDQSPIKVRSFLKNEGVNVR